MRTRTLAVLALVTAAGAGALGVLVPSAASGALAGAGDRAPATAHTARAGHTRAGFETGDFSEWTAVQEAARDRVRIVSSPVRSGRFAARFEHRAGDYVGGGTRAEVYLQGRRAGSGRFREGDDVWFGWSTRFARSFPRSSRWGTFLQWKQNGVGAPPIAMSVSEDRLTLIGGRRTGWWESAGVPIRRGRWHDWVVHVRFSADPRVGFVEVWHNRRLLQSRKFLPTLHPGRASYLKQGIYRDARGLPRAVVWHDALDIGRSYRSVAPRR